ncbi:MULTISPECIES: S1 family peptidase [Luteimonas]|uniref:S1 family peptidase n=1 Tax=Luteimonas TaxID=83614 RepID=UPI00130466E8|nr:MULTISPECIES: S1 family peptidase [Luteimonas]
MPQVVIRFTEAPAENLSKYTSDPLFVAARAEHPLELIKAVQREVGLELSKSGIKFESVLDMSSLKVRVGVLNVPEARRALVGFLRLYNFVEIVRTPGFHQQFALLGGIRYQGTPDTNGIAPSATFGFNVVHESLAQGIVSAGHAVQNIVTVEGEPIGLYRYAGMTRGSVDAQWHMQSWSLSPPRPHPNQIQTTGPLGTIDIDGVTSLSQLGLGSEVCKQGRTTGYTCGKVIQKDFEFAFNGEIGTYVLVEPLSGQGPVAKGGDSGGPVFQGSKAVGMVHGGYEEGDPRYGTMVFIPIENIEALKLKVITEKFQITSIPDVSGLQGVRIPASITFTGYPRFVVNQRTVNIECPEGWECSPYEVRHLFAQRDSLTFNFRCAVSNENGTTTFRWRTTLTGADGAATNSIEHSSTCVAPDSVSPGSGRKSNERPAVFIEP